MPGDWVNIVQKDFEEVNLKISEEQIRNMCPLKYKSLIKEKMRDAAFLQVKEIQASHEKRGNTYHESLLQPQKYLVTNKLPNKQKSLLIIFWCQ